MTKKPAFTINEIQKTNSSEIIIKNNFTKEFVSIIAGYGGSSNKIKSIILNGKQIDDFRIKHGSIVKGGKQNFIMKLEKGFFNEKD